MDVLPIHLEINLMKFCLFILKFLRTSEHKIYLLKVLRWIFVGRYVRWNICIVDIRQLKHVSHCHIMTLNVLDCLTWLIYNGICLNTGQPDVFSVFLESRLCREVPHLSLLRQQSKCLNPYFAMWSAIWLRFQHRHGRGKGWTEDISPMRLFIFHQRGEKRVVLQLKYGWHCCIIPASVMKGGRHFHLCCCVLKTNNKDFHIGSTSVSNFHTGDWQQ